jgi:glycosyltransferase involved in cell wall biosynthesis
MTAGVSGAGGAGGADGTGRRDSTGGPAGTPRLTVALSFDAYFDYVRGLAGALAEHCDVVAVGPARWPDAVTDPFGEGSAVRHVRHDLPRVRNPARLAAARRFVRLVHELRPDVVHVQQSGDPWFNLVLAASRFPCPVVHTIHDVTTHPGDRAQVPGAIRLQRAWRGRVDRFIVHADPLATELAAGWRVPAERIRTVAHGELGTLYRRDARVLTAAASRAAGVELADRAPAQAAHRREPATVLFYGRRWGYKGFPVLVDALAHLAPTVPHLRLVVAGTGEDVSEHLRRLPAHVAVEVHDRYVDAAETVDLFDRATVVSLPYIEGSQSGVAALGLGLGCPVVASAVGGIPSMVRDGHDGLLVPPGNVVALATALERVIRDDGLRERLIGGSVQRCATDLSWATAARDTAAVYAEVARR